MLRKKKNEIQPKRDPVARPDYVEADVQALRAVARGQATEYQQRRAIDWIIRACGTYDLSFRPDSERLTTFAEGKRWAGMTLVWMLQAAPTKTDDDKISVRHIMNPHQEHHNAEEQR